MSDFNIPPALVIDSQTGFVVEAEVLAVVEATEGVIPELGLTFNRLGQPVTPTAVQIAMPDGLLLTTALANILGRLAALEDGTPVPTPQPTLSFDEPSVTVSESADTISNALTVVRDGAIGDLLVNLAYAGSATGGADYLSAPTTVTIPAVSSTVSFDITISDDSAVESSETIAISASLATYPGTPALRTITVTDNDVGQTPAPVVATPGSISPTSGQTGQTFTATDAIFTGATSTSRTWLLDRTAFGGGVDPIGSGTTVVPNLAGDLYLENDGSNAGGTVSSTAGPVAIVSNALQLTSIDASGRGAQTTADNPSVPDPDGSSPFGVGITRQGFDAAGAPTSYSETRILTRRTRQSAPNNASLTLRGVQFDDYFYTTDSSPGVTNNSTESSPKPICAWAMPDRRVVGPSIGGSSVPIELVAAHRNARNGRQVACVIFKISDGTNTISVTVSTPTISPRATDKHPLAVFALPATSIASLAEGAITVNAEVYPWIGDGASVARSATDGWPRAKFAPRYFLKDDTLFANPPYIYISATGNDTTGQVSIDPAVAKANPVASFAGARTKLAALARVDGARIRVGAGTFALAGGTALNQFLATTYIERDPDVAPADAIITFGAAALTLPFGANRSPLVSQGSVTFFGDFRVNRSGAQGLNNIELYWEGNPTFDNAGNTSTYLAVSGGSANDWVFGATFLNLPASAGVVGPQTSQEHRMWRGLTAYLPGTASRWEVINSLACDVSFEGTQFTVATTRTPSGIISSANRFHIVPSSPGGAIGYTLLSPSELNGFGLLQNLFEWSTSAAGHPWAVSHDSGTVSSVHVVVQHNTFAGFNTSGRCNLYYDEGNTPRTNRLSSDRGNIFVQVNIKGDRFRYYNQGNPEGFDAAGPVGPSTRIGNWAFLFGVGSLGNFIQFTSADGGGDWLQEYPGRGSKQGTSATVRLDPLFTDPKAAQSGTTSGAGGGTYTLQPGSPAASMVDALLLSHDFAGSPRASSGKADAGAYRMAA